MRHSSMFAVLVPIISLLIAASNASAENERLSGPFTHENLSVYFVHGKSAAGPIPLTLQEALDQNVVQVVETSSVNELEIRNTGDEPIFIQSGDLVKGGRQDRVVTTSFILPPKSGSVPLASFCVEHGRWSQRGAEPAGHFSSSSEVLPSRKAKLAMKAPLPPASVMPNGSVSKSLSRGVASDSNDISKRQQMIWDEVAATQEKLSDGLKQSVKAAESDSSLQLSLENKELQIARAGYISDLEGMAEANDILGYVFAVNGKIYSADIYPSNSLFRKMWGKLLASSITEAIGDKSSNGKAALPPDLSIVKAFLADAESGETQEKDIANIALQDMRDTEKALYVGVKTEDGTWVHRSYLKK